MAKMDIQILKGLQFNIEPAEEMLIEFLQWTQNTTIARHYTTETGQTE